MNMPLEELRFIVDSIIPQGLHILSGQPKEGKSWLLLSLCLNVTLDEKFWNFETEKGTVLYLYLEDSLNRIQSRLFDITEEAPSNLHFAIMVDSLNNGLLNQIEDFIKDNPDTILIVIDTLQKVRDNVADANSYSSDYKDIGMLKAIADK
jgi:RecA-family ATPase